MAPGSSTKLRVAEACGKEHTWFASAPQRPAQSSCAHTSGTCADQRVTRAQNGLRWDLTHFMGLPGSQVKSGESIPPVRNVRLPPPPPPAMMEAAQARTSTLLPAEHGVNPWKWWTAPVMRHAPPPAGCLSDSASSCCFPTTSPMRERRRPWNAARVMFDTLVLWLSSSMPSSANWLR